MNAPFYPDAWPSITREIKEAVGWRCQACGIQCRQPGEFYLGWQYELAIAHLDHCYDGPVTTVAALCARCHFMYDAPMVWVSRRRWARWRLREAGQLAFL